MLQKYEFVEVYVDNTLRKCKITMSLKSRFRADVYPHILRDAVSYAACPQDGRRYF